jgi:hypothetical protein
LTVREVPKIVVKGELKLARLKKYYRRAPDSLSQLSGPRR